MLILPRLPFPFCLIPMRISPSVVHLSLSPSLDEWKVLTESRWRSQRLRCPRLLSRDLVCQRRRCFCVLPQLDILAAPAPYLSFLLLTRAPARVVREGRQPLYSRLSLSPLSLPRYRASSRCLLFPHLLAPAFNPFTQCDKVAQRVYTG